MPTASPVRPAARFADTTASLLLDAIRGGAAFLVLISHWRVLFFVSFHDLPYSHAAFMVPYVLTGAGHVSVIVFFVLSGFFIGGTVMNSVKRERWSWSDYLLRRSVRLWIVLIPALLLTVLWDNIGLSLHASPGIYAGVTVPIIASVVPRLNLPTFLSNLFFLQTIVRPPLGSDGALWSLAYEFWYYMLFPTAFFALRKKSSTKTRVACAILFLLIAILVHHQILFYFPIWLMGVVLARIGAPKLSKEAGKRLRWLMTPLFLLLLFGIGYAKQLYMAGVLADYIVAVFTFLYLWVLLTAQSVYTPGRWSRFCREIARFSYSLYALHVPVVVLLAALLIHDKPWLPTPAHLGVAFAALFGILVYAYAVAYFTEFRTDAVRKWLEKRLGLKPMASIAAPQNGPG